MYNLVTLALVNHHTLTPFFLSLLFLANTLSVSPTLRYKYSVYPWSSLVEGDEQQDRSIGKSTCEPAEKKIFYLHGLSSLLLRGPMLLFNSFYYLKCSMAQSFKQHRLAYSLSLSLSRSFSQISRDHLTPHYPKLVVNIPHLVGVRPTQTGWSRTFK